MSDWQPIETAPKHDFDILLGSGNQRAVVRWENGYWKPQNVSDYYGAYPIYLDFEPTHWMPLPEPPKDAGGDP